MKFDPFNWQEVTINDEYESPKGRLHIMCSQNASVYVQALGYEVLAGVGQKIDITTAQAVTYRIEAPEGTRAFVETREAHFVKSSGEIFTNFDKKPTESGAVQEINRALRRFKLEQQEIRRQMRIESQTLRGLPVEQETKSEFPSAIEPEPIKGKADAAKSPAAS